MVNTRTNNTEAPRGSPPPQLTFELNQEQLSQIIAVVLQKAMEDRISHHENRDSQEENEGHGEDNEIPHGEGEKEESRVPNQKRNEKKGDSQEVSKTSTMAEELEKLMKKVKRLEGQAGSSMMDKTLSRGCPFSDDIVHEPLPAHYKSAKMRDYDGSADPEEHLARFENIAMLHCYEDKVKCKAFLTTLVDSAQKWFDRLEPGSICSFEDFESVFLHHFSSSKKYKKTAFSLFELRQSGDESLRAYIRRFNRAALEVPSCASETKNTAFTQGLREGDFFRSLVKKLPKDFEDLLSRAEKYINMEEAEKQKRESLRKEKGERIDRVGGKVPGKSTMEQSSRYTPPEISRDRGVNVCEDSPRWRKVPGRVMKAEPSQKRRKHLPWIPRNPRPNYSSSASRPRDRAHDGRPGESDHSPHRGRNREKEPMEDTPTRGIIR